MPVTTNLDLMQVLAERIGGRVAETLRQSDSSRVVIQIFPKESGWYVERGVLRGFTAGGLQPVASGNAAYVAEFGISKLHVRYENVRREGIFGPKLIDRKVYVGMSVKVTDQHSGAVLISNTMEDEIGDSIQMSDVASVESAHLPVTMGALPREGFFSNVAEPLIALGSIALAVFLLFHVRS